MADEIRVLIVEDDFYARNLMELLLRRDWRTSVVGEVSCPAELSNTLEALCQCNEKIDVILIDTDIPADQNWLSNTLRILAKQCPKTAILFTGVASNPHLTKFLAQPNFVGYILKDEIRFALAWAVLLGTEHHIVITPGVYDLFENTNMLRPGTRILDGRNRFAGFTESDTQRARMAFVYSMERHEFADELGISEDYSYGVVSDLFEKTGLNDVLKGDIKPEQYFGDHPAVLAHVKQAIETIRIAEEKAKEQPRNTGTAKGDIKQKVEKMVKVKEKESLAFHLLTLPEIEEIT